MLVKRLRQRWPKVQIILRGDSGFCRWPILAWCDRHGVDYIVGIAKNARLNALSRADQDAAAATCAVRGRKVRRFTEFPYAAASWDRPRRVIAKAEHNPYGANPRYVVTSLSGQPQYLYERLYCARGDMQNRIKEQQLGLFADRTSCHHWWSNQFRLLLASLAYTLVEAIRRLALASTRLARAQVTTLRLSLFNIGAVILRNTRRVRFLLASGCPYQDLIYRVAQRLAPD